MMAANFIAASSQQLTNAVTPITAVPFTVGFWAYPRTTGASKTLFIISDSLVNNYFALRQDSLDNWQIVATESTADTAGTIPITTNAWQFIVGRFIDATNRRLSVLSADGSVSHAQGTASKVPPGLTKMALGSLFIFDFYDGLIGDFWYTKSDIQADGGQLDDNTVRQLAYGGPFSIPHIAKDIVEYRSLRKFPTSDGDEASEVYFGGARQNWTNTAGVTIGPHSPLPYWYVKPNQVKTELVI